MMMTKYRALGIGLAAASALSLGGCANNAAGAVNLINAVESNLTHCHHQVTYSASAGPINPGSGVTIQGTIDCPAILPAPPAPLAGAAAVPAPAPTPGK